MSDYLTQAQAAKHLNVSITTFRKEIRPHVQTYWAGCKPLFKANDLDEYMTEHAHVPDSVRKRRARACNVIKTNAKAQEIARRLENYGT